MRFAPSAYASVTLVVATTVISYPGATTNSQTSIARYGEWEVTGDVDRNGRIAYRATLEDHNDKRRNIEFKCWPSAPDRGFTLLLFDGAIKGNKSVIVTFNNSRLGTIDQLEGVAGEGYVDISKMFLELVGCGMCNPATRPHSGPLLIAIKNRELEFAPSGADFAWAELAKRCHF